MKIKDNKRINKFIKEHDIWPLQEYYIVHHEENFVVLKTPQNNLKIYILGKKAYIEEIPISPIYSFEEIRKALNYREFINLKSQKGGI